MNIEEDEGKSTTLLMVMRFLEFRRIDIRMEIAYILSYAVSTEIQRKVNAVKLRKLCLTHLKDEVFMRRLRKRLSITEIEGIESAKYWDKIIDKFEDTYNYDKEMEIEILEINMELLQFLGSLIKELDAEEGGLPT